jgi:hypothetical protein
LQSAAAAAGSGGHRAAGRAPKTGSCRSSPTWPRERGVELPLPLGAGGVYYYVERDIA